MGKKVTAVLIALAVIAVVILAAWGISSLKDISQTVSSVKEIANTASGKSDTALDEADRALEKADLARILVANSDSVAASANLAASRADSVATRADSTALQAIEIAASANRATAIMETRMVNAQKGVNRVVAAIYVASGDSLTEARRKASAFARCPAQHDSVLLAAAEKLGRVGAEVIFAQAEAARALARTDELKARVEKIENLLEAHQAMHYEKAHGKSK